MVFVGASASLTDYLLDEGAKFQDAGLEKF